MSHIAGWDERDRRHRAEQAKRKAELPLIFARNRAVEALRGLEPEQALAVLEGLRRSIQELLAVKARQ